MEILKSKGWLTRIMIVVCFIFTGCSEDANTESDLSLENNQEGISDANESHQEDDPISEWDESSDPVTVKFLYPYGEDGFEQYIKKFKDVIPSNIHVECVCTVSQLDELQEMNADQIVPDLMFANYGIDAIDELGMLETVDEYVEKYDFDLDGLDQSVLATYRYMDPEEEGRLIGLPTFVDTVGLLYNKDLFDMFGVEYPDPDIPMTWEEVYELTQLLTGEREGIQYRGLELNREGSSRSTADLALRSFGVNLTDPHTGEVFITELPEVKEFIDLMSQFYNIPGFFEPAEEERQLDQFAERTAAMTVSYPGYLRYGIGESPEEIEAIDVAPVPVWEEGGKGPQVNAHPLVLNKFSENKEAGFQVMAAISQTEAMDPLTSPYHEFGPESEFHEFYEGKNMKAFWDYEGAYPEEKVSKWDSYIDIRYNLARLGEGNMDTNQFLRVLKEESEAKIQNAMGEE